MAAERTSFLRNRDLGTIGRDLKVVGELSMQRRNVAMTHIIGRLFRAVLVLVFAGLATAPAGAGGLSENENLVARGRYLIKIAGCNDCHTPGYLLANGNVPEERWLTGYDFGWRGPWGTTYGTNLRLFMRELSEDEWVATAKTLARRPPMPWFNLNAMAEEDLRAIYRFTRSLGDPGNPAPDYVPPDEEPKTPYALFPSPPDRK